MGAQDSELQEEWRYQVTSHTWLASRGDCHMWNGASLSWTWPFSDYIMLMWEEIPTRLSLLFPYCKWRTAGQGLGTMLGLTRVSTQDGWTNNLPMYTSNNITHCKNHIFVISSLAEGLGICLHFWHFYHDHATQELLQGKMWKIRQTLNLTRNADL